MAVIQERTSNDGKISYRVLIRLKGYPVQTATFARKTDAKIWAQKTEAEIREGRHFQTSEAKKRTLAEVIDRYAVEVLPQKPKSAFAQGRQLDWWKEQIGHMVLVDITPGVITSTRETLKKSINKNGKSFTVASVNRYMAALSHVFSIAYREWGWANQNPFSKVSKLKEPRGRTRFLTQDEIKRFLQACKESRSNALYPIVLLALSTGARKSEILQLHWEDVDFERSRILIHETKNTEKRSLPLVGHAGQVIKELYSESPEKSGPIFQGKTPSKTYQRTTVRRAFLTALTAAGIEDFRFHDLRHTAASYLAMNGASLVEISEILGHKTLQMVKRYSHLTEGHTSKVVEKMNQKILGGLDI